MQYGAKSSIITESEIRKPRAEEVYPVEYLYPSVPEMKIRDYKAYCAWCCGLCSQIRQDYGRAARLGRSRDCILFALLNDSLAGREGTVVQKRCPRHGYSKRCMICHTRGLHLAAQVNVLLVWHVLNDGPGTLRDRIARRFLDKAYYKAVGEAPAIERVIQQQRAQSEALRLAGNTGYERSCEPTANLFGALFAYCAPDQNSAQDMRRVGYSLGQILHLLSQVESYLQDLQYGRYNIFLQNNLNYEAARGKAQYLCSQFQTEMRRAFRRLDIKQNRELLENMLFQGLDETVANVGRRKVHQWEKI